jgi:hypothetical protein
VRRGRCGCRSGAEPLDGRAAGVRVANGYAGESGHVERGAVAVRNGASLGDTMEHHDMLNASLFAPLVDAIAGGQPEAKRAGGSAPWGPWTTVYYTDRWDVGPGETSSFPPKWMSVDGTIVHLVFSGDDAFSVRRATIVRRWSWTR